SFAAWGDLQKRGGLELHGRDEGFEAELKNRLAPSAGSLEEALRSATTDDLGPPGSIRFDAHKLHHLAPFLGFVGNELAKIGGRARKHRAAQVGKPCPELGIGKASIDLLVELHDDLCRRILG